MALASDRSAGVVSPPGAARLACARCNGERERERARGHDRVEGEGNRLMVCYIRYLLRFELFGNLD
jgi:hypothetical protein